MCISGNKVKKHPTLIFGPHFKTYLWKKQYYNIGIIVPLLLNCVIYTMEVLHKVPKFGFKPHSMPSYMKRRKGMMDIFISDHNKKSITSEKRTLQQSSKQNEEVEVCLKFIYIDVY